MIKEPEKPFEKIEYVFTEDYSNVLIADIGIIIVLLLLSWRWREQRIAMFVGASLYGLFTALWHFPPGLLSY